jgi:hypothetical protein
MAVIYMNGFEWNNMAENITAYYSCALQTRTSGHPVRSGEHSISVSGSSWFETQFTTGVSDFYVQFAFRTGQAFTSVFRVFSWRYEGVVIGSIAFDGVSQHLQFYTGDPSTGTLRMTGNTTIVQNVWYYVELHVVIDPSSGLFDLRMDGIPDTSYGGPTQPGADYEVNRIRFESSIVSGYYSGFYVDDIVVNDTTGSVNTSWVNCLSVFLLRPWGVGSSERWDKTSTTALNNYECVDGAPSADPTEYLFTEYGGKLDLYLTEDLPIEAYSIEAVRADAWACKTSGSRRNLEVAIQTNASTFISSTHELDMYYTLYGSYWEQNPAGGTHWSVAEINALEVGMRSSF